MGGQRGEPLVMLSEARGNCRHGMGGSCVADALQACRLAMFGQWCRKQARRIRLQTTACCTVHNKCSRRPDLAEPIFRADGPRRCQKVPVVTNAVYPYLVAVQQNRTGWVASSPRCRARRSLGASTWARMSADERG